MKANITKTNTGLLRGQGLEIFLHILAWMILFILPTYFFYLDSSRDYIFISRAYLQILIYMLIFYINFFWLAPKFFFNNKKTIYFVTASAFVLVMALSENSLNNYWNPRPSMERQMEPRHQMHELTGKRDRPPRPSKNWPLYNFILNSVLISGFGLGIKFLEKMIKAEKQHKEMEKQKLDFELAFLKQQINPHFFFNTLNNIYALVQTNTDDGQKAIIRLSKIMRYFLDEPHNENVLLSKEIEFMSNYIELMKLRLSDKVKLNVSFPDNYPDVSIPSLLFIPLIENAFKHGISYREQSFINIKLDCSEQEIFFSCINSIVQSNQTVKNDNFGIGLENVKKRLALLFPGKYEFNIIKNNTSFNVTLIIKL